MRAAETALAGGDGAAPVLVGDADGSYIFPDFHPGFDGMMAVARLMQYLGVVQQRLSQVLALVPPYYVARTEAPCPWDAKGLVMRGLYEVASQASTGVDGEANGVAPEQIEGVRFDHDDGWALVVPDADRPVFHVYAEGGGHQAAEALMARYVDLVKRLQTDAARPLATI
jgi:mannose-1-phosphate guanylyltransferase/phosphomannomutase